MRRSCQRKTFGRRRFTTNLFWTYFSRSSPRSRTDNNRPQELKLLEKPIPVELIDALLPQTQCRCCGYDGCWAYAKAISTGKAEFNQCPPGGKEVIHELAALLDRSAIPLNPKFGETKSRMRAVISEVDCIGCTLCIRACPVDAIVGAIKQMHTVLADWCTGCELCLAPCPVNCITMVSVNRAVNDAQEKGAAALSRVRYRFRQKRLALQRAMGNPKLDVGDAQAKKIQTVNRAMQRARERLSQR